MAAPIEAKVKGGTAGAIVAGLADWLLAKYLFPHGVDATGQALILAAVPGALSFVGGYLAKHTPRPLAVAAPVAVVPPAGPPA